jgi:hypothetical protein
MNSGSSRQSHRKRPAVHLRQPVARKHEAPSSQLPLKYISRPLYHLLKYHRCGGLISCYQGTKGEFVLEHLAGFGVGDGKVARLHLHQNHIPLISQASFSFVPQNSFFLRPGLRRSPSWGITGCMNTTGCEPSSIFGHSAGGRTPSSEPCPGPEWLANTSPDQTNLASS